MTQKEKINHDKTKSERVAEIVKAMIKIKQLGFPDTTPGLVEFKKGRNNRTIVSVAPAEA